MADVFRNSAKYFFLNMLTEPLELTPLGGSARSVRGYFNVQPVYSEVVGNDVVNQELTVSLQTSDCAGMVRKSAIKRKDFNETYYVIDPGIDISGITEIKVSRKQPQ